MRRLKVFMILLAVFTVCFTLAAVGQMKVYKAAVDKDGIQRVNMLAGGYFYDPDYIIVKVNVPVEITIRKEPGVTPHDIVIKEPDAGIDISESLSTDPKIITFTPRKTGKYPFYCSKKLLFFQSHRDKGMKGVIEVTD